MEDETTMQNIKHVVKDEDLSPKQSKNIKKDSTRKNNNKAIPYQTTTMSNKVKISSLIND